MRSQNKMIRLPEVMNTVGLKKTAIYKMIKVGEFPKPVSLSKGAKGWLESEVQRWIGQRSGIASANDGQREAVEGTLVNASASVLADMLKAPLDGEALGAHEIARITGYALERDQVKWLTNNKWRFHLGGDGRPVLGRMYARLRLCGIDPELFFAR